LLQNKLLNSKILLLVFISDNQSLQFVDGNGKAEEITSMDKQDASTETRDASYGASMQVLVNRKSKLNFNHHNTDTYSVLYMLLTGQDVNVEHHSTKSISTNLMKHN
jgi:hypothetical protein